MLTQERVRELFDYNPETGELIRKVSTNSRARAGDVAGGLNSQGYLMTHVDGGRYYNHRLIFLHAHGYMPENHIDHINRNCSDNRVENLREVSASCNMRNMRQSKANTSGVKGVYWNKAKNKWEAYIRANQKFCHLGRHSDFTEVVAHRLAAEQCLNWNDCDANSPAYQHLKRKTTGAINGN
jgi:hypothetical protein